MNEVDFDRIVKEETVQATRIARYIDNIWPFVRTVLDVGCGPGIYVDEMRKCNIDAYGIDIDDRLVQTPYLIKMDMLSPRFKKLKNYDLSLCLEVAEHMPEDKADDIVESLVGPSNRIIFSAGGTVQSHGPGHLNCQPKSYWIEKFNKHNFVVDETGTNIFLKYMHNGYCLGWLINNGMILHKKINNLNLLG